ncbi:alpha-amylase family glycosyl hydrolase [Aridibaculum aurantiacum]|uniref:alpha-amylase family glycosyl hydrolase n=1 Tax=Aridibaculum aurantiacum TaxID=2810307 RepID=UPI001A97C2D6|nr:alpha-amylase family glycosyl hydrolase [Aridibaculum aurantiacum]
MKKLCSNLLLPLLVCFFFSCKNNANQTAATQNDTATQSADAPEWILQGNIYEVNIRQYTPEGTFNAFAAHLDRLREMGVQTLWFMPIQPISVKDRKGTLGSYYAIADYTAANPEFGTMDDWKRLVNSAHEKGFKVIIDWVANHTGADHRWLQQKPDFFTKDSTGNFIAPYDWTDVRELNYDNRELHDSMTASMKFWVTETGVDGFRCDVAGDVPDDFWKDCIATLQKEKQLFMLAEGDKPSLHTVGFHASYAWPMFSKMKEVANGSRPASALDSVIQHNNQEFPANAMYMYFTSNHDENSWNKADYGTMPGKVHEPFAVFTQTAKASIPLIYSGQEEPVLRKIEFFEKDPMTFNKLQRAPFYKTLLTLRKNNTALAADAAYRKLDAGDPAAVYAYVREKGGKRVLVVLNLSGKQQTVNIQDQALQGNAFNVFANANEEISSLKQLEPWGYRVYEYR